MVSILGVTSYQDIGDCLKLVIDALRYGDIKPWVWKYSPVKCCITKKKSQWLFYVELWWFYSLQIHRDSSSSLSKLILQSYHQQIDHVSLSGVTPVHMLLEMGLDKMRKDYINYLIGTKSL